MAEDVAEDALRIALEEELRKGISRGEVISEQFIFRSGSGLAHATLAAECLERIDLPRKVDISEALGLWAAVP